MTNQPSRIIVAVLLVALGVAIGVGYSRWSGPDSAAPLAALPKPKGYHCPMHPNFRSEKPGDCGICGMKMVADEEGGHQHAADNASRKILHYRDPKDPNYKSDKPGLNPETGNDLEPVYADDPANMPMGTVYIPAAKQQLIGVKFATAELASQDRSFRTVGKVTVDETRVAKVQTRIEGWIEKVFVDFTGKVVERGQPLLTIYSPELLASQQELLLALRSREILKKSPLEDGPAQGDSLILAARKRLQLFDLSDSQIDEVIRTQKPLTNITLHAPMSGYVMMRNAFPKQRVTPETELYTVVDLSRIWIMADVFESEAENVRVGMPVSIALSYGSGKKTLGRVSYIQPQVDATTRTLKVRIEADNPDIAFKPDMFADVEFRVGGVTRLTVPSEAVLDSGLKKTVFVDRGNGYLEPRQVETGEISDNHTAILKGLKPGERVVVSGNFLIDSESQLKSAAAGMAGHQHGSSTAPPSPAKAPAPEHKHD